MWQWEHQQHALSQHFRVLTLDLPGSGLSDKPEIDYRPDQMLDFFVGFMDAVQIPQATLVGNSMGAGLAIGMALTHPTRVAKLVLIGGLPTTRHGQTHQSVGQAGAGNQRTVLARLIRQLAVRRTDDRVRPERNRA